MDNSKKPGPLGIVRADGQVTPPPPRRKPAGRVPPAPPKSEDQLLIEKFHNHVEAVRLVCESTNSAILQIVAHLKDAAAVHERVLENTELHTSILLKLALAARKQGWVLDPEAGVDSGAGLSDSSSSFHKG